MKRLGVFLLPSPPPSLDGMLVHRRLTLLCIKLVCAHLYASLKRGTVRVKYPAQKLNKMSGIWFVADVNFSQDRGGYSIQHSFSGPIPCVNAIDLGVILDATNSVGRFNFNISKKFALALVNSMAIAPGASHFALMVYNIYPTMLVKFNEANKQNTSVIKGILQRTEKLKGRTYTDRAIKMAGEFMFTPEAGERPDKPDVLVVLTDGRTNEASEDYHVVNKPLRVGKFIFND